MLTGQRIVFARYLLPITSALRAGRDRGRVRREPSASLRDSPRAPHGADRGADHCGAASADAHRRPGRSREARSGTVDVAYTWIVQNIPAGSYVVLEQRELLLPDQFRSRNVSQLRPKDYEQWRDEGVDYLVASSRPPRFGVQRAGKISARVCRIHAHLHAEPRDPDESAPSPDMPGPEFRILQGGPLTR